MGESLIYTHGDSTTERPNFQQGIAPKGPGKMLHYSIVFFVIALIAAVFGFGGIASGAVEIAKILFFVFIVLAVLGFVFNIFRKR